MQRSFEIGARIRQVRGDAPQAVFAERLGVNRTTIRRWEEGELLPNGTSLLNLMMCYGVDANWILTGKGSAPGTAASHAEHHLLQRVRALEAGTLAEVFALLKLERYLIERQDHEWRWDTFARADTLEEAHSLASEGLRRIIDLFSGQVVFISPGARF